MRYTPFMFAIIAALTGAMLRVFGSRRNLLLENLVLRQQLAVLKRKRPRTRIAALDKLFWVLARRLWSGWKQALIIVSPDTVVRWHRAGLALYWRAISGARRVFGRKRISKEVRDLIFRMAVRYLKMNPVRTSFESPWQNGVAKRWVESCRRDLLDHVIAVNERHLKRLLLEYVHYYHEDRAHLGLGKGTNCRTRSRDNGRVLSHKRLGGLHHRYDRAA
jgi:hypothetical protein